MALVFIQVLFLYAVPADASLDGMDQIARRDVQGVNMDSIVLKLVVVPMGNPVVHMMVNFNITVILAILITIQRL